MVKKSNQGKKNWSKSTGPQVFTMTEFTVFACAFSFEIRA